MPVVYDNWGRLVQAVQRREQYWEMAHADSRSTSTASSVSLDFDELSLGLPREDTNIENDGRNSRSDYSPSQLINDPAKSIENDLSSKGLSGNGSKSRNSFISSDASRNEVEWNEKYEDGVYITVVAFQDGSRDIKRARFSKRRFTENQAETWWSENREKVYKKYNIRGIYGFSASNKAAMRTEGIALQGINGSKARNSVGSDKDAWNEQYEDGVYLTVVAFQDGSRDIKRARFSKRRFTENQAETWWSENREKVYKKYNIHGIYNAASRTEGVVPQGINSSSRNSVGSVKGDAISSR